MDAVKSVIDEVDPTVSQEEEVDQEIAQVLAQSQAIVKKAWPKKIMFVRHAQSTFTNHKSFFSLTKFLNLI